MTHNLKPEVAEKLRRLLLSGKFKKTTGELRDGTSCRMCILGVTCELFRLETGQGRWDQDGWFHLHGQAYGESAPPEVVRWADGHDDCLTINDQEVSELNDGADEDGGKIPKWSFKKFADALKPKPKRKQKAKR